MQQSVVPADLAALVAQHGPFVPYVIKTVIPHHLSDEDLEDLVQDVLLTLHTRQYLDACRAYEQTCWQRGVPYSFLASLRTFVSNLAKNYLRHRHAMMRDPLRTVALPDHRDTAGEAIHTPAPLQIPATQEAQALAAARLDRLRRALSTGRRVIGGRPAHAVLETAMHGDGQGYDCMDKNTRRQLRVVVQEAARAAR